MYIPILKNQMKEMVHIHRFLLLFGSEYIIDICLEKLRNYKEHLRNFVEGAGNILGMELSMDSYSNWYHIQFFVKEELVFIMLTRQEQVYYRYLLDFLKFSII